MKHKIFQWLSDVITEHSGKVLIGAVIFTVIMLFGAGNIKMKTKFSDMLPGDTPQVTEYEKVINDFTSTSTIMITVADEKGKDKAKLAQYAEELADSIRPMHQIIGTGTDADTFALVDRIDLTMDRDFIEKHGFMIQKNKDLKNSVAMFHDLTLPELLENINNNFEQEYTGNEENLASLDGEASAIQGIEGIVKMVESLESYIDSPDSAQAAEAASTFISGENYFFSPDNTTLLMMVQPTVTMDEFEKAVVLTAQLKKMILHFREKYPDFQFGYSGALMLQQDETDAVIADNTVPSIIALLLIVLLLAFSFRTWKTPFLAVSTLVVALIWVAGAIGFTLEYINIMSASFAMILIGLGIDFGIHSISGFRDGREQGMNVKQSIEYMYDRTATGIITGGVTTALVFFSLSLTGFKAFSEMGLANGMGIIIALLAMITLLPALIVFTTSDEGESQAEQLLRKMRLGGLVDIYKKVAFGVTKRGSNGFSEKLFGFFQFRFIAHAVHYIQKPVWAAVVLVLSVAWAVGSLFLAQKIRFEYDMLELEPKGIISGVTQDSIISKFEMSPDFALYLSDDLEETRDIVQKVKKAGERTGLIGQVEAITELLPSKEEQTRNLPLLNEFRAHLDTIAATDQFDSESQAKLSSELQRLHFNLVEIGELQIGAGKEHGKLVKKLDQIVGKSDEESRILAIREKVEQVSDPALFGGFQKVTGAVIKEKLQGMSSPEILAVDDLPESIRDRYLSEKGQNLVTIYPNENIWDEKTIARFNENMYEKVSPKVTGTPAIMQIFFDLMKEKGSIAVLIGAIFVALFLVIDFRSIKDTILAMVPLAIGTAWMLGFMYLFDVTLNVVNFMALPLIIGIGIDDGVHILHRYKLEGRMSLEEVMRYTGRAILLTSLTTSIGFGSMAMGSHRGLASMGLVLIFGVASCFVTSAFVLTSLISLKKAIFKK